MILSKRFLNEQVQKRVIREDTSYKKSFHQRKELSNYSSHYYATLVIPPPKLLTPIVPNSEQKNYGIIRYRIFGRKVCLIRDAMEAGIFLL